MLLCSFRFSSLFANRSEGLRLGGVCFYLVRLKSPRAEARAESFNLSRARWYHGEMQETFLECQLRKLPGILAIEV